MSPRAQSSAAARAFRILLLAGAALALMEPYLTHGIIGGGDAKWYSLAVGDFVTQVRAGMFPVWAGQSRYLYYGGIFPLRVAPYLEHLAALVDLLTGRSLPVFTVMNLALTASLLAGILSCYFCLASVIPARPWLAVALAFLYASCPGVIGLAYAQDLYMSFTTLPFLPIVFLGIVRSFDRDDLASRLLMAGGLAGAWLAHPPIALTCGIVAVASQAVRLLTRGIARRSLALDAAALVVFFLLGGYTLVSAAAIPGGAAVAARSDFIDQVRMAFPDNWKPLPRAVPLDNLQLGFGLAALFCWAAWRAVGVRNLLAGVLVACGGLLLLFILPVPVLNPLLWHLTPQPVLNLINIWPMQRLLVVLALCTVFAAAVLARGVRVSGTGPALWLLVIAAAAWGGYQAGRLATEVGRTAPSVGDSAVMQRPENLVVTNMFIAISMKSGAPRYASGGAMDPELENRLLDPDTLQLRESNVGALAPGFGPGPRPAGRAPELGGTFTGTVDANPGIVDLSPGFTLAPGRRYLLLFGFADHPYSGTLLIQGRDFFRQYNLPFSGEPRAFGSGPECSRAVPLWTTSKDPVEVRVRFVPTAGTPVAAYLGFGRYELREYDPAALPIRLESLLPYRARVTSGSRAFLETPRLAIPGYRAVVDGVPVPIRTSPDGYVAVPITPGEHEVTVECGAPAAVRIAYWSGLACWLLFVAVLARALGKTGGATLQPT
jgi:hypothetical protein